MGLFGSKQKFSAKHSVRLVKIEPPTVDLSKVAEPYRVSFEKKVKAGGGALAAAGLLGYEIDWELWLDYSGSMGSDYRNGSMQTLSERILAIAVQTDQDGIVPVVPWADGLYTTDSGLTVSVNVTVENYVGAVQDEIVSKYRMGGTDIVPALADILRRAPRLEKPLFVVIVTDGDTDRSDEATTLLYRLAEYPVFVKFISLGSTIAWIKKADNGGKGKRLLDNVHAITLQRSEVAEPMLGGLSYESFSAKLVDKYDEWIQEALRHGTLTR